MLKESMKFLKPEKGKAFVDATINGGGHSEEILRRMAKDGLLIGVDQDGGLIESLKIKFSLEIESKKLFLINGNFRDIENLTKPIRKTFDGAFFDLGFSSFHIEKSGRGFSFQKDEPLIMTYDNDYEDKLTAEEIINHWSKDEIEKILREYGEERWAKRIASAIVEARKIKPIKTTAELASIIAKAVPRFAKKYKIHPATRSFQALRIAVNDELNALKDGLDGSFKILKVNGRLVVVSFHSLEDRIVKRFFRQKALENKGKILTKKPVVPLFEEIRENPRSRSAKLRAIVKTEKN